MRRIDEQHTKTPFYGVPRLTAWLRSEGHVVNRKRVARLMHKMGLAAIYPKPKPSAMDKPSKTYPYLLRGLSIVRPNQVWAIDITYIRLSHGFVYLVAVMDWFSRYVLSWELSNSLDVYFCLSALERALSQSRPVIFNTDQGSQFTADAFTARLHAANVRSAGTVEVAILTISSLNGSGAVSSMRRFISTTMTRLLPLSVD